MNDAVGRRAIEHGAKKIVVAAVADGDIDRPAGYRLEQPRALLQIWCRNQRFGVRVERNPAAEIVIHREDIVPLRREMHRCRPSKVTIPTQDQNAHSDGCSRECLLRYTASSSRVNGASIAEL